MPELPEVETTRLGIKPFILKQKITNVVVRHRQLRWQIPAHLEATLKDQTILLLERRGKYLLLSMATGTLILHLGMSGSLRIVDQNTPAKKHDHLDIALSNHKILRFTDPRRFGAALWTQEDPSSHTLLKSLGPEPLSTQFSSLYLWQQTRQKKTAIKSLIMDSKIVVGVGNIYATEALFEAQIHPKTQAGRLSRQRCQALTAAIKAILRSAIKQGGTTLKDFTQSDGKPGYFKIHLRAYGRANLPCLRCGTLLSSFKVGQRNTVYCKSCQKK